MKNINTSILPLFFNLLTNLKYLNLSFNKLENIENLEDNCPNLIHLDVSHNFIKKLRLKSLLVEYLDISHNKFEKIEDFAPKNSNNKNFMVNSINRIDDYMTFEN